jgi:hypothetical protein
MRIYVLMRTYCFFVTEYDPGQPWIMINRTHHAIDLDDDVNFYDWARDRWPSAGFRVDLDPSPADDGARTK